MNLKIGLIFRLLVEFFITLLMFIMLVQGDFLIKMAIYPFIIILLSDIIKNIIFLKRGIVDNLFFSKVSAIGFFLFIFQLLSYITFLFISSKVYFLLITILPFWIFTVVYFKKKIFDNYDVVLECLKNGRFISFFILTFLTIIVLLGMVFMYIGFTSSSFYMYKDYIVTTGYYTEYEAIKTEEGLNYKLIYSYNVDGVDYLVETEYYTNNLPNEGAARNIKYNPLNHSQAIVVGGGAGDVLLLVGFMFFIIPLAVLSSLFSKNFENFVNIGLLLLGLGFVGIGWLAFYLISGSFSIIETLRAFSSNYLAAYFLLASFWFIGIMVIIASFTNKK